MKEFFSSALIFISTIFSSAPAEPVEIPKPEVIIIQEEAPAPPSRQMTKEERFEAAKKITSYFKNPDPELFEYDDGSMDIRENTPHRSTRDGEPLRIRNHEFDLHFIQDSLGEAIELTTDDKKRFPESEVLRYNIIGNYDGTEPHFLFHLTKIKTPSGTLYKGKKSYHTASNFFVKNSGEVYHAYERFPDEGYRYHNPYFYNILKGMSADPYPESLTPNLNLLAVANPDLLAPLKEINDAHHFYEFKEANASHLKWLYERFTRKAEYSYEEWLADKPIVYFKSIFGEYTRGLNGKFIDFYGWEIGRGGGGKPVIYLYPTTTQEISVSVYPNGGFTITDPEPIKNTWAVTSTPDSVITYQNQNYPYLFWEGVLVGYQTPTFSHGFTSDKSNIESTLSHALTKSGLNAKEITDFNEFWVPTLEKLMTTKYVTLHLDTEILDNTAPLDISPQPDNVLRVFLDYEFTESNPQIPEQNFRPFSRDGFAVVEWGGRLDEVLAH